MDIADSYKYLSRDRVVFLLFCVVGGLLYFNTLNAPFYFDDIPQIVNRPYTYDLSAAAENLFGQRGIVNLTFALNFHFFGLSLPAFHLFNIILHVLTTFFVFLVLKRVFPSSTTACFFGAVIFLVHPLQTQTVNYIVQRMTGMSGFFVFLSLYLFIRAKEGYRQKGFRSKRHVFFYSSFLITAALAVLAKQNAATLPLLLFLFEITFLKEARPEPVIRKILYLAPALLAPIWIGFEAVISPMLGGTSLVEIGNFEKLQTAVGGGGEVSPLYYFVTQLSVFWIYFKLLFLPLTQALDYGYPVVLEIFSAKTFFAAAGLMAIIALAWFVRRRNKFLFFSVFWFFIALAVESSFIPLDPVFEHRLYVPMFGFSVFLVSVFEWISSLQDKKYPAVFCMVLICVVYGVLTSQRNAVWADPLAFFQSEVENTYGSYRPYMMLADELYKRGELAKAKEVYDEVLQRFEAKGVQHVQPKMLLNVAVAYARFEEFRKSERLLRLALSYSPTYAALHYNLGVVLYRQGQIESAYKSFRKAVNFSPGDSKPLNNLGYMALYGGRIDEAENIARKLSLMNPELANDLRREIRELKRKKQLEND